MSTFTAEGISLGIGLALGICAIAWAIVLPARERKAHAEGYSNGYATGVGGGPKSGEVIPVGVNIDMALLNQYAYLAQKLEEARRERDALAQQVQSYRDSGHTTNWVVDAIRSKLCAAQSRAKLAEAKVLAYEQTPRKQWIDWALQRVQILELKIAPTYDEMCLIQLALAYRQLRAKLAAYKGEAKP